MKRLQWNRIAPVAQGDGIQQLVVWRRARRSGGQMCALLITLCWAVSVTAASFEAPANATISSETPIHSPVPQLSAYQPPWDAPHRLASGHSWGAELVNQSGWRRSTNEREGLWYSGQEIKMGWAAQPLPRLASLVSLKWQKVYLEGKSDQSSQLGLESAYLSWLDKSGAEQLAFGRYYYEDSRGFLFHQSVDGLHVRQQWSNDSGHWLARFFAGHQGKWKEDLLASGGDDSSLFFAQLQWRSPTEFSERHPIQASVYGFSRETHNQSNENPWILGWRSRGYLSEAFDHWLELMISGGESGDRSIRAFAVDLGGVWDWRPTLSVIAGYAYGSGDRENERVDRRFRQTGLQLNNGWIGQGGVKLKYYGELSKPELSNIAIGTLGVRWNAGRHRSLELLYHSYRQAQRSTTFYGYGLSASPNGVSRQMGDELDLVIGYQPWEGLKLELNLAHFRPGSAFDDASEPLNLVYVEARYRF